MQSGRADVTLAVAPTGSANDYAHALGLPAEWWRQAPFIVGPRQVDVARVRSGEREKYFCNCFGLGFNGHVTRESRGINRLSGVALYGLALLRTVCFRFATIPLTVQFDDHPEFTAATLALSLAIGPREGNFVVAPDAVIDDGLMEYVHGGALTRTNLLGFLPGLVLGKPPVHPQVRRGRCRTVRLQGQEPLIVHVDGEFFCLPEEGIRDLEVELLPGELRVLGRTENPYNQGEPGALAPGFFSAALRIRGLTPPARLIFHALRIRGLTPPARLLVHARTGSRTRPR